MLILLIYIGVCVCVGLTKIMLRGRLNLLGKGAPEVYSTMYMIIHSSMHDRKPFAGNNELQVQARRCAMKQANE